jgi:hypothetical protein
MKILRHNYFLPPSDWENYYRPMQESLDLLRNKYRNDTLAMQTIIEEEKEIEIFKKYHDFYSYVFYVMKRQD